MKLEFRVRSITPCDVSPHYSHEVCLIDTRGQEPYVLLVDHQDAKELAEIKVRNQIAVFTLTQAYPAVTERELDVQIVPASFTVNGTPHTSKKWVLTGKQLKDQVDFDQVTTDLWIEDGSGSERVDDRQLVDLNAAKKFYTAPKRINNG